MIRKLGAGRTHRVQAVATARPGDRHDRRTPPLPQLQAGPHPTLARHHLGRGAGRRRRHRGSPLRRHGLAAWSGRERSRKSSPKGISARGRWCSTTSPAATTRGRPARWPASATTATARPAARSSSMACSPMPTAGRSPCRSIPATPRPQDRPRPGRGAHEAVRPVASRAGWRSWHAHANSN